MMRIFAVLFVLNSGFAAQDSTQNLPELNSFLKNVRAHLQSDRLLQSQYAYKLKETEIQLDKKGDTKKTEVNEYEVYPSLEEGFTYLRHMSKNGKPLSPEEIEKQDRKHDKKLNERAQEMEREGADERARRLAKEAEEKRKEDAITDELFQLYDISITGRDFIEGTSTIQLQFKPRKDYEPKSREAKILAKISGRAWFCEEDYELTRVEVELVEDLKFGLGVFARLNKGAKGVFLRRRINGEIWLPAETSFSGSARLMLLKGMRIKTISEFSDYKKFTVGTSVKYSTPAKDLQ
jgi:hypothetical protein